MLSVSAGLVAVATALVVVRFATGRGGVLSLVIAMVLAACALVLTAVVRRRSLTTETVDWTVGDG